MIDENKIAQKIQSAASKYNVSETRAAKFMKNNPIMARRSDKISSVIKTLKAHFIHGMPVVNNQFQLMGIITEHDLMLQVATKDFEDEISFTKKVEFVFPETTLNEIILLMFRKRLKILPVVEGKVSKRVVGVVTRRDIIRYIADQHDELLASES